MRISSIRVQVKNPERTSVFIDGKYSFSLTLNELVSEKLKIGQQLTEADLKRLKKLSEDGKLKAQALKWVMSRPRSMREFKDYLYRKKAESEFTDRLIIEFTERGYINEQRYAEWLSDMRQRKGKSNRAIRSELASKGISREIIEALFEDADELERLKAVVAKKSKVTRYQSDPQKFMHYLARQGFAYDDIKQVLSDL